MLIAESVGERTKRLVYGRVTDFHGRNAGRRLSTMLQCVQPEEGQLRRSIVTRYSDDATHACCYPRSIPACISRGIASEYTSARSFTGVFTDTSGVRNMKVPSIPPTEPIRRQGTPLLSATVQTCITSSGSHEMTTRPCDSPNNSAAVGNSSCSSILMPNQRSSLAIALSAMQTARPPSEQSCAL